MAASLLLFAIPASSQSKNWRMIERQAVTKLFTDVGHVESKILTGSSTNVALLTAATTKLQDDLESLPQGYGRKGWPHHGTLRQQQAYKAAIKAVLVYWTAAYSAESETTFTPTSTLQKDVATAGAALVSADSKFFGIVPK